jgi:endonuclease-8
MPEGHTLVLAAQRLAPLAGATVRAESFDPRGQAVARALDGVTMGIASARGKHLLWPTEDGRVLHSHLRMRGSWRLVREGERWPKPQRLAWLALHARGLVALQFNGPVLELLTPGRLAMHPGLAHLGPDVLAPGFDAHRAARSALARAEDRQIADVLLDQRVACGIGNIAKSEALWTCRVDPFLAPEAIGEDGIADLFVAARGWLARAVRHGGDAARDIYGQPGCKRCGSRTRHRAQGDDGRTTWWCPACQAPGSGSAGTRDSPIPARSTLTPSGEAADRKGVNALTDAENE